jgi:hypothetical protein
MGREVIINRTYEVGDCDIDVEIYITIEEDVGSWDTPPLTSWSINEIYIEHLKELCEELECSSWILLKWVEKKTQDSDEFVVIGELALQQEACVNDS